MTPPTHASNLNASVPRFSWNGSAPKPNYLSQPVRRKDPDFEWVGGAQISWKENSTEDLMEHVNYNELFEDFTLNPEEDKEEAEQDVQALCNKKMKVKVVVRNIKEWEEAKKKTGTKKNEKKDTNLSSLSQGQFMSASKIDKNTCRQDDVQFLKEQLSVITEKINALENSCPGKDLPLICKKGS